MGAWAAKFANLPLESLEKPLFNGTFKKEAREDDLDLLVHQIRMLTEKPVGKGNHEKETPFAPNQASKQNASELSDTFALSDEWEGAAALTDSFATQDVLAQQLAIARGAEEAPNITN